MAQYKWSNANVTQGSNTVTLVGVDATSEVAAGDEFIVVNSGIPYVVNGTPVYASGNTAVTLSVNYAETTASGVAVTFQRDYTTDGIPILNRQDVEPATVLGRLASVVQSLITSLVNGTKAMTNALITGGNVSGLSALSVAADSSGNVARYVMKTANGGVGDSGYWAKLLTVQASLASQAEAISFVLSLSSANATSGNQTGSVTVSVVIYDSSTVGLSTTNSAIKVIHTSGTGISADSFMLVGSASENQPIELWVRKDTNYQGFSVVELNRNEHTAGWSIAYNNGATWSATTPSGAVTITSDWAKPTRVAWTPVVEGETTAGTATYTTQLGYYWYENGFLEFLLYVTWSGHTGTGLIRITGLPKPSAAGTLNALTVGYSNIATTQTTATVLNGSSFVRVYDGSAIETVTGSGSLAIKGRMQV